MHLTKISYAFLLCAGIAASSLSAVAACITATLSGVYGVLSTGLNGSHLPATSVDRIVTDGNGNLAGSSTKSIDGTIVTFTFAGTYQVNKDGTGSTTLNNQDASVKHVNFALNNGHKGAFLIQTDDKHQNPASWSRRENGTGSLTGTETVSINGAINSNLPVMGTYAINPDCTGTLQVAPQGSSPGNFSLLIVNPNKEALVIETDANTIANGTVVQ